MQSTVKVACFTLLLLGLSGWAVVQGQQPKQSVQDSAIRITADDGMRPGSGGG